VFTDASDVGFEGYIEDVTDIEVTGSWYEFESMTSSTWRELGSVNRMLLSNLNGLKGKSVIWKTDDKNVPVILSTCSSKILETK
jgi:hypothetical protein